MNEAELVEQYAPLVQKLAAKLAKRTHFRADIEDLYSEGMIGLLQAARSFDPKRGVKFGTYAGYRISGAMTDWLREQDWVPRVARDRSKAGHEKRDSHYKSTGERVITEARKLPRTKVDHVNKHLGCPVAWVRGQDDLEPIGVGGLDPTFQGCAKVPNPYVAAEQADSIRSLTRHLSREQRFVVLSSVVYGISHGDIAKAVGISPSMVSIVHKTAMRSLRGRLSGTISRAMGT